MSERVLSLVICVAGPAGRVETMVRLAQAEGWSVHCLATPAAVEHFLDVPAVAELSGHPVRTTYRGYVLNQLAELTGLGLRIVVLPFLNQALAANRAFLRSVEELRQAGVHVLFGPGGFEPHPPRTGAAALDDYPWQQALAAATSDETDETVVSCPGNPRPPE